MCMFVFQCVCVDLSACQHVLGFLIQCRGGSGSCPVHSPPCLFLLQHTKHTADTTSTSNIRKRKKKKKEDETDDGVFYFFSQCYTYTANKRNVNNGQMIKKKKKITLASVRNTKTGESETCKIYYRANSTFQLVEMTERLKI